VADEVNDVALDVALGGTNYTHRLVQADVDMPLFLRADHAIVDRTSSRR